MDKIRIVSDGGVITRVMDSAGREIPGLTAVSITIRAGEPVRAVLEAALVELDIQADAIVPRQEVSPMSRWPFPTGRDDADTPTAPDILSMNKRFFGG